MGRTGPDHYNDNPNTKICTHCLTEKAVEDFSRHPLARKGRKQICKACDVIQGRKNHDERLAKAGKTRMVKVGGVVSVSTAKRGDVRADGMVFHSKRNRPDGKFQEWWMTREDFDRRSKKARERVLWRFHNDPVYREKARLKNTSEAHRAMKRRWNKANRVYLDEYLAGRRAKIEGQESNLTTDEKKRACEFYAFRDILNNVHGFAMFEVDHIKPISRGGLHHPDNLRITTAKFNRVKFVNQLCPVTFKKTGSY